VSHKSDHRVAAEYIYGSLKPWQSVDFAVHLTNCAACRRDVAAYNRVLTQTTRRVVFGGEDLPEKLGWESSATALRSAAKRRREHAWYVMIDTMLILSVAAPVGAIIAYLVLR
jgi:anti-sigma factor ChrR (cupin superfamily)